MDAHTKHAKCIFIFICGVFLSERMEELAKDMQGPPGTPGVGMTGKTGAQGPPGYPGKPLIGFDMSAGEYTKKSCHPTKNKSGIVLIRFCECLFLVNLHLDYLFASSGWMILNFWCSLTVNKYNRNGSAARRHSS